MRQKFARPDEMCATGCRTGKRAYPTRAAAKAASKKAKARGYGHMRAYLCRTCGLWHFGHVPDHIRAGVA